MLVPRLHRRPLLPAVGRFRLHEVSCCLALPGPQPRTPPLWALLWGLPQKGQLGAAPTPDGTRDSARGRGWARAAGARCQLGAEEGLERLGGPCVAAPRGACRPNSQGPSSSRTTRERLGRVRAFQRATDRGGEHTRDVSGGTEATGARCSRPRRAREGAGGGKLM